MAGALEGLRVVDLTVGVAGPLAGMMLADNGADVVKVEPPGGDPARGRPGFLVWNRGKRIVRADPESARDNELLAALVARADVVLVGTQEPGLDDTAVTGGAPVGRQDGPVRVIVTPYLLGHTPWVGGKESAELLFADLGQSWGQASEDDVPVDLVYPVPLYLQGVWTASVAVASAISRMRHGVGSTLAVGGAHGAMMASPGGFALERGAPRVVRAGGPRGGIPNYRAYRCADGQWLFLGAFMTGFIRKTLDAVDAAGIMDDPRIEGDFNKFRAPENFAWVSGELDAVFARRPREEWLDVLGKADVPAAPVGERDDWLDHPQARAMGFRVELADEEGRDVVMPGVPVRFERTPGAAGALPSSTPGPLADLGEIWPEQPLRPTRDADAAPDRPLQGFKVLDFGLIIAGPYAATQLRELGADVVKVERPPYGDEFRAGRGGRGSLGFSVFNRGQRGLAMELADPEARSAMVQLLSTTDVVLDNFRPGGMAEMGLGWDTLAAENPRVVSLSVNAFGGVGPLGPRPGFDPVLQALSGIMHTQGGPDPDDSPVLLTVAINDVLSATLGSFAACAALYARERSGVGQQVTVALAGAATLVQSEELVRYPSRPPGRFGGRDFPGPTPANRLYAASDGWVRLAGSWPQDRDRLERAGLLDPVPDGDDRHELSATERLVKEVGVLPADEVVARLAEVGLPAVRVRMGAELIDDAALYEHGAFQVLETGDGGAPTVVRPGRWFEIPGVTLAEPGLPPELGEESPGILEAAGVDPETVRRLVSRGVVVSPGQG